MIDSIKGYDILYWKSKKVAICRKCTTNKQYILKFVDSVREIQVMQKYPDNYNLVKLIETFKYGDQYVIIVQKGYCNLRDYLEMNRGKQINKKNLYNITRSIINGLKCLHYHLIWHRDIKAENIFIFFINEYETDILMGEVYAKIGDFGSSESQKEEQQFTVTDRIESYMYKSPEILRLKYNSKADIWGLGLVLFEIYSKQDFQLYNNQWNKTQQGVNNLRYHLKGKLHQTIKDDSKLLDKLLIMIENTIQYDINKREDAQYFISLFQQKQRSHSISDKLKQLQNLNEKKDFEVLLKITNHQILDKKLTRLIQSTKRSKQIIMKSTMLENLNREKILSLRLIQKLKNMIPLFDKTIDQIEKNNQNYDVKANTAFIDNQMTDIKNYFTRIQQQSYQNLDLCLMIPTTVSMRPYIHNVREKINQILKVVQKKIYSVRFACIAYTDIDKQKKEHNIQVFKFMQPSELIQKISQLQMKGGQDLAHDINNAFQGVLQLTWLYHTKILLHITDAPCHLKYYNNLYNQYQDYKQKPSSNIQYKKIFKQLKSVGIHYFLCPVGNNLKIIKSIDLMYSKFQQEWNSQKVYRGRCNIIGKIQKISLKMHQFAQIVKLVILKASIYTDQSIQISRNVRLDQNIQAKINADDQVNVSLKFY